MGRRRQFIDKRRATTYQLVFRSEDTSASAAGGEEDGCAGERVLVPVDELPGPSSTRDSESSLPPFQIPFPFAADAAFDGQDGAMSEERRREIVRLGLPDDGYDYLRHLRVPGVGRGGLEAIPEERDAGGGEARKGRLGGVFVAANNTLPLSEDQKVVDARQLPALKQTREVSGEEELYDRTTSAFSREVKGNIKGRVAREVAEVDSLMAEMEALEVQSNCEGADGLEDDFLLEATVVPANDTMGAFMHTRGRVMDHAIPVDADDEEYSVEECSPRAAGNRDLETRSVFSERWLGLSEADLEGRRERNENLRLLDERFEQMILKYDDDELGCLEEKGIAGERDMSEVGEVLIDIAEDEGSGGMEALAAAPKVAMLEDRDDDVIAITKKLQRINESVAGNGHGARAAWEDVLVGCHARERLDCESVLSYRSRASSFQPARIEEPRRNKQKGKGTIGPVVLSGKTGFPVEEPERHQPSIDSDASASKGGTDKAHQNRKRGETTEERKARKAAVKCGNKEARVAKKELKSLYRKEVVRQQKQTSASTGVSVVPL
ncbi:unnamed protein product [Ostreobium quekettii]|uniref:Low temperature viability protein n=1 Tax=Ostreobium quekettii TaxID=121088 RepID=A0A8S1J1Y7_9CHLO|nr:unnamed protein product [Ostreobium quekettii]